MLARIFTGIAIFGVGFLIGREVGKLDPIVEEMRRALKDTEPEGQVIEGAVYSVGKPTVESPVATHGNQSKVTH